MHHRDWKVIELGAITTATRGWTIGFAESELGMMAFGGLWED